MNNSIWVNLGIEDINFVQLAKMIIPPCEFPIRTFGKELIILNKTGNFDELLVPRFHYATKQEEKDILAGIWNCNKNYEMVTMPYGFYFPDCLLRELKYVLPSGFDPVIDNMIAHFFVEDGCLVFNKQLLFRAIFIVLHEYGHYINYRQYDLDKERYAYYTYESKEMFREFEKALKIKGNISEEDKYERKVVYRNCADEKFADDYAMKHIEEIAEMIFERLKKDNC